MGATGVDGTAASVNSESETLSEDELFEVLSNRRRRYALHAMTDTDGRQPIGPLAEQVAAWENDVDVSRVSSTERKRAYTALQQNHLPKMDQLGVVDYDKQRGVVEPTAAAEEVDVYLEVVTGRDIPWNEYYLGLAAVCAAIVTAVWVDVFPFAGVPDIAAGAFVVTAFSISAVAHHYVAETVESVAGEKPPEVTRE